METEAGEERPPAVPRGAHVAAVLPLSCFGVLTALLIRWAEVPALGRPGLLLFAAGGGAVGTALLWLLCLGLRRGPGWAAAWLVGVWIPYVNLLLATAFARRYWHEGARAPGLLGLAGGAAQALSLVFVWLPERVPVV